MTESRPGWTGLSRHSSFRQRHGLFANGAVSTAKPRPLAIRPYEAVYAIRVAWRTHFRVVLLALLDAVIYSSLLAIVRGTEIVANALYRHGDLPPEFATAELALTVLVLLMVVMTTAIRAFYHLRRVVREEKEG